MKKGVWQCPNQNPLCFLPFPEYMTIAVSSASFLLVSPQNYSCPSVMVLAVPVAVRFLQRGNRELSRNMSSYLSLAAIAKADLLAEHTEAITLSVLGGRAYTNTLTHTMQKQMNEKLWTFLWIHMHTLHTYYHTYIETDVHKQFFIVALPNFNSCCC